MGLPRYENIDQLPNISMAVKNHIQYIVQQTVIPIPDEEAITELQEIIDYLLYLLSMYQPQMYPAGDGYYIVYPVIIDPITPVI